MSIGEDRFLDCQKGCCPYCARLSKGLCYLMPLFIQASQSGCRTWPFAMTFTESIFPIATLNLLILFKKFLLKYSWLIMCLISNVEQSDSVIHIYVCVCARVCVYSFSYSSPLYLSKDTECSFLCYTVRLVVYLSYM